MLLEDDGATGDLEQPGMSQAQACHSNGDADFHAAWAINKTHAVLPKFILSMIWLFRIVVLWFIMHKSFNVLTNKDCLKWYRVFGGWKNHPIRSYCFLGVWLHTQELPWNPGPSHFGWQDGGNAVDDWSPTPLRRIPLVLQSSQLVQDFCHQQQCQWPHITENPSWFLEYQEKGCKVKTCKPCCLCFFLGSRLF